MKRIGCLEIERGTRNVTITDASQTNRPQIVIQQADMADVIAELRTAWVSRPGDQEGRDETEG